ncbi:hypothetical protein YK56LOC_44080 [Caballeronia sp. HLA56]
MSSTAQELVDCAEAMARSAASESEYRAVCSRAYYGAFHAANAFHNGLPVPGSVGRATGRHEQLIAQLANPGCGKGNKKYFVSQALSKGLRLLVDNRVKADYHIDVEVNRGHAQASVAGALVIAAKSI